MKKRWYDYLWIASLLYLLLGFFNILFAWLGLLCFFIPLIISLTRGTKGYCNRYCGRGQLFALLGGRFGLSRRRDVPGWMKSRAFRYGFLIFFLTMFFLMLWNTWLVFAGVRDLQEAVTLLWTLRLPWHWAYRGTLFHPGVAQFAFGFYSVMLTSTVLGRLLPHGHHDPAHLQGQSRKTALKGRGVSPPALPASPGPGWPPCPGTASPCPPAESSAASG